MLRLGRESLQLLHRDVRSELVGQSIPTSGEANLRSEPESAMRTGSALSHLWPEARDSSARRTTPLAVLV